MDIFNLYRTHLLDNKNLSSKKKYYIYRIDFPESLDGDITIHGIEKSCNSYIMPRLRRNYMGNNLCILDGRLYNFNYDYNTKEYTWDIYDNGSTGWEDCTCFNNGSSALKSLAIKNKKLYFVLGDGSSVELYSAVSSINFTKVYGDTLYEHKTSVINTFDCCYAIDEDKNLYYFTPRDTYGKVDTNVEEVFTFSKLLSYKKEGQDYPIFKNITSSGIGNSTYYKSFNKQTPLIGISSIVDSSYKSETFINMTTWGNPGTTYVCTGVNTFVPILENVEKISSNSAASYRDYNFLMSDTAQDIWSVDLVGAFSNASSITKTKLEQLSDYVCLDTISNYDLSNRCFIKALLQNKNDPNSTSILATDGTNCKIFPFLENKKLLSILYCSDNYNYSNPIYNYHNMIVLAEDLSV